MNRNLMANSEVYIGEISIQKQIKKVFGEWINIESVPYYKINNFDQMPPFFMSLATDADLFLFISSKGALTAGRKNPQNAIFPYYTVDKIHDSADITGSKTIFLVTKNDKNYLWEPFSQYYNGIYNIQKNLYKNLYNTNLIFEEINFDLGLVFSYSWTGSKELGIIKKSSLTNLENETIGIRILDGMQNILPAGINLQMQTEKSNLLDAYKKNELIEASGIGLYLLSSIPVDRAEPSESLNANIIWTAGLNVKSYLLSTNQLDQFRSGLAIENEYEIRAHRGAYFIESNLTLKPGDRKDWYFIADLNKNLSRIREIENKIISNANLCSTIEESIKADTNRLIHLVAKADGIQKTDDQALNARHFANVLFNSMRGGIFQNKNDIKSSDFSDFIKDANSKVWSQNADFINALPIAIRHADLKDKCISQNDKQLYRLFLEYLPISFSRRHGDPSRPWNKFSIELEDQFGNPKMYYEGNWRDIFQNWEALAVSFPDYLESMIAKFVNASTIDGYNPYRISRKGVDWEVLDKDDPWSFIGYWGDHQIIYLLKLMELSVNYHPGSLSAMLEKDIYSFSNVPYRIKSFNEILENPNDTIDYDFSLDEHINEKVKDIGSDGKLILNSKNDVYLVNLTEKILISLLTKISNLIPDAGIWLNTQRPEWNDANNALVGNGCSMVTVNHLLRYINFCQNLFIQLETPNLQISEETFNYFEGVNSLLKQFENEMNKGFSAKSRFKITTELGKIAEHYRVKTYKSTGGVKKRIEKNVLLNFFQLSTSHLVKTIQSNKRIDGLYHSYNLVNFTNNDEILVEHLDLMLEGQVAALNAGQLKPIEVINLLEALKESPIYRQDQDSYLLYPDKDLKRYTEKNIITQNAIEKSELLSLMLASEDERIVNKDINNEIHFNSAFRNKDELLYSLNKISANEYPGVDKQEEKTIILAIYESVFNHRFFTGRSGSFFGYEGLGSIYWHMVSKLILAVAENFWWAFDNGEEKDILNQLKQKYYALKNGLGMHKNPMEYGAFPTDPYSHTPAKAGAKQPGMTGQVKEDILSRFLELGIRILDGRISFNSELLKNEEFHKETGSIHIFNLKGEKEAIALAPKTIAYTFCQIPIIYHHNTKKKRIVLHSGNGELVLNENFIPNHLSEIIFQRTGEIHSIEVFL